MVARLGANPVPTKTTVSGKYRKSIYEAGEGSFPYIYYEIDGMGHEPGTNKTEDGNSALTMWNFFKQYTLDTPCDTTLKWAPRIEAEGYSPRAHGWTMNSSLTLLKFGEVPNTSDKQNVYRTLQFNNGNYKLHFKADGDAAKKIIVKIQKLTDKKNFVLNDTIAANGEANLFFKVEDGWGEYKFLIIREANTDAITISDITIHTASDEELTSIQTSVTPKKPCGNLYTLAGIRSTTSPRSGDIYIRNNKKFFSK
jgi:hypothetical protein